MQPQPEKLKSISTEIATLLRGEVESLHGWLRGGNAFRLARELGVIVIGSSCYGAAMGWWRSPEQCGEKNDVRRLLNDFLVCAHFAVISG